MFVGSLHQAVGALFQGPRIIITIKSKNVIDKIVSVKYFPEKLAPLKVFAFSIKFYIRIDISLMITVLKNSWNYFQKFKKWLYFQLYPRTKQIGIGTEITTVSHAYLNKSSGITADKR